MVTKTLCQKLNFVFWFIEGGHGFALGDIESIAYLGMRKDIRISVILALDRSRGQAPAGIQREILPWNYVENFSENKKASFEG